MDAFEPAGLTHWDDCPSFIDDSEFPGAAPETTLHGVLSQHAGAAPTIKTAKECT